MSPPRPATSRLLRAIAPFGLAPGEGERIRAATLDEAERTAARVLEASERSTKPGYVALLTGPSGSGKSTLLKALSRHVSGVEVSRRRIDPRLAPAEHRTSISIEDWLGILSLAGLADARVLATPAHSLSEGELARLRLALGMASVRDGRTWLIVDECCSVLDRDTASGVCAALRRWADRTGARVIAASAHDDLVRMLGPDLIVRMGSRDAGSDSHARIEHGSGVARGPAVRLEPGTMDDYRALSRHHYRPGSPAGSVRVIRATTSGVAGKRLAGILVVTYPTLNGAWREFAWPGRYGPGPTPSGRRVTASQAARRLNREVRRISRVIIDPRDRGRGLASKLVRAYLDDPETPATEAVAAMGRLSAFSRSAGMTEYQMPPRPADDRLADVLHARGIEPWMLLDPAGRGEAVADRFVAAEIERWGRSVWSSVPGALRDSARAGTLAPLAAGRLIAPPLAYAHVHGA